MTAASRALVVRVASYWHIADTGMVAQRPSIEASRARWSSSRRKLSAASACAVSRTAG